MKKIFFFPVLILCFIIFLGFLNSCGKKEKSPAELAVGNWIQYRNNIYILLVINPKGEWRSSVRVADATSKIVKSKGSAKGLWSIEKGQMIFSISQSDIEQTWKKNDTLFFEIVELTDHEMKLRDQNGVIFVWKKTSGQKASQVAASNAPVIHMGPVTVNLDKDSSNDPDRYLCLDMDVNLKELMPDQKIPGIHPGAMEAAVIFLSSLVYNNVKDFSKIKQQVKKLVDILNPYMHGVVDKIIINHVIIADNMDKVEEFIIEHTPSKEAQAGKAQEGKSGQNAGKAQKAGG
jgi:hypothetical protein